ncbi:hypothetical protein NC653_000139 [Populus alba x Populus x berolinensis]|uniref:Reverse transcriptase domain-containing protein n=1 Tax=Populus alba x Populus x berolinensis TaxID=444605 RepID=A0AAD6RHY9_9ROSI|nr:hypothetical protein NC653_000139 [Populus alba x Populus x berolinensis]
MLGIIGLLETKISPANLNAVTTSINLPAWKFLSNAGTSPTCRILVGWDPSMFNLSCLQLSDQWVTCDVFSLITKDTFKITFVYGLNTPAGRSSLWNYIKQQAPMYSPAPWILLGDFNAILKPSDRSGGDQNWNGHQNDFGTCIQGFELTQIPYSGLKFTWHNGQLGGNAIMRKLDWIFGNHSFLLKWPSAYYKVLPRDHSDHSALILECQPHSQRPPASPFNNPIYSFTAKLKTVKLALRDLHIHNSNNISKRVADAKAAWTSAQVLLDSSPAASDLIALEKDKAKIYAQLCREEEAFYRQRSRVQWLHLGDRNTKHFQRLLIAPPQADEDISRLFPSSISGAQIPDLEQPVTNEEIKTALFSIPDDKAPGPDGFTSLFFKKSWSIIGADFMRAVSYFFEYSIIHRCINATRISLVPKVENPACMDDYRPISCCNVLYKCISKVLVARLKLILPDVISPSQSAFIPGRQISDNILLTQELLHNYHLNKGPARCALKIDLKKAFDTISWQFILKGLQCIGIPVRMINWINACISSAFFSVGLNGSLHGFFPSSRGLRQGDPLPPYLFVIAMEGLGGILKGVAQVPGFQFHWRCKLNSITHLEFVDDLMVFCHADLASVELIRGALKSFSSISGLIINHNKSFVFISGVEDNIRVAIANCLHFQLGALPIKYLGVPLISSRLSHRHCTPLVERIISRINLWTSASLTYAGAKVTWASLCYPKTEGGLGIKRIKDWNKAAILKLVWRILTESSSIWVAWTHSILLRGRCFWFCNIPSSSTWSWRKLLLSRTWSKGYFAPFIGNGRQTSLWLDYWLPNGRRFCDFLPFKLLSSTNLPWNAKVADIISEGRWAFPEGHADLLPLWNSINFLPQDHLPDHYIWRGHPSGQFNINTAWELIRESRPSNTFYHLIWFPGHVPRHAFILWIASLERLSTMDRLQSFRIIHAATCILCGAQEETHEHLFFQCPYSASVWREIARKSSITWPSMPWQHLLQWAAATLKSPKIFVHNLAKSILSTTVYFIWYERNNRIFNNVNRTVQELGAEIFQLIRACLLQQDPNRIPNCFKNIWSLPES